MHVLLIEDDPVLRTSVLRALDQSGWAVSSAPTALTGIEATLRTAPDVVLLDLGLPDLSGAEVLRMLRATTEVPVLVVTAQSDEQTVIQLLDLGADDYLVKPFTSAHLQARIRAVLRRTLPGRESSVLRVGELTVDPAARTARLSTTELDLAPREFDLLEYLCERAGEVVTKRELLKEVWRQPYGGADKTVDVHLSWLRRKLGETASAPVYLHTVRGVGVRLAAPA